MKRRLLTKSTTTRKKFPRRKDVKNTSAIGPWAGRSAVVLCLTSAGKSVERGPRGPSRRPIGRPRSLVPSFPSAILPCALAPIFVFFFFLFATGSLRSSYVIAPEVGSVASKIPELPFASSEQAINTTKARFKQHKKFGCIRPLLRLFFLLFFFSFSDTCSLQSFHFLSYSY